MSNQGAPPQRGDGWWHEVYTGPAATLRDAPETPDDDATVDDWFDSAAGMIGAQRTAEAVPVAEAAPDAEIEAEVDAGPDAGGLSVDDWFDSALGMIGTQRSTEVTVVTRAAEGDPDDDDLDEEQRPETDEIDDDLAPGDVADVEVAEPEPVVVAVAAPTPPPADALSSVEPLPPAARRAYDQQPVPHVGDRPPTYGPEPTAVAVADPEELAVLTPDTVLEGAQYGPATLRAVSVRGDSARYRGELRRDALLITRFGEGAEGLLLAVVATTSASAPPSPLAAEACRQLAAAIGRSRAELAADLRDGARDRLRYGLQRLTTSAFAPLRAPAATPSAAPEQGADGPSAPAPAPAPDGPSAAALHCLLLSLDPAATHRAAFGLGPSGLYLLRSGHWIDAYAARLLHHPDGQLPTPTGPLVKPFRFRLVPATPGDILLLCTPGLADPLADEPAVAHFLANHWAHPHPPGTVDFLRQIQVRAKGYSADRTAAALWTE
ncbi:protein phosphatase 2C domain-containing protein [Kitasatospora sp. NBC_00070]|uniref:protein phosphatase 2C domain-containing protein n=1 Tax=Kitasatospora sp. NBC_00070 TaxID=2975962 RepID=UPI003253C6F4